MKAIKVPRPISPPILNILSPVLAAGFFIYDLMTPLGYTITVLYIIPLLLISQLARPRLVYKAAALFTLLIVIRLPVDRPDISWMVAHNKLLGITALWTAAYLLERKWRAEDAFSQSQAALKASEERFRTSLDTMLSGFAILSSIRNEEGRIVDFRYEYINETGWRYINETGGRINGRNREGAIGRRYMELFPGSEESDWFKNFVKTVECGEPIIQESSSFGDASTGGNTPRRAFNTFAVKMGDGLAVSWLDVTERMEAAEALRESERRYRTLFNEIDEGFCIIEMIFDERGKPVDYRFLEVNPAFEKQTGLVDATGKRMRELIPKHEEHWFEIYGKIALTGEAVRFQDRADQLNRWYDVYAFRFGNPEDRQVAVLFNDILEKQRAEEALREREARYRELVQDANSAILRWNAEGTITFFNEYAQEFFGWSAEEVVGRHVGILLPERETTGAVLTGLERNIVENPERYFNHVNENICRDGRRVWMTWTNRFMRDEQGRVTEVLGIGSDITDLKRAEEALRASLAEKDILLRELAHRTKNNMQVIAGLLSLQAASVPDETLVEAFADAQDRIRAMALVHEKLFHSGTVSSLDMKEYIRNLFAPLLKANRGNHGLVTPVLEVEEIFLPLDTAQPCGLIINELISNSLKHAFRDGKEGKIFLSLNRKKGEVVLRYRDDGPGLSRELDPSSVRSLGLRLIHSLAVRQLRGTMELVHHSGTEFVFRFPLQTMKSDSMAR